MKRVLTVLAALVLSVGITAPSDAAVLDFSSFPGGDTGLATLDVGDATVTVPGGTAYVFTPGMFGFFPTWGGVCALDEGDCETDWTLTFDYAVDNLNFLARGWNLGDVLTISAYGGASLLGTTLVAADGAIDLSLFPGITSLVFDDSSTGAGFAFGEFTFDRAVVPEPASLLLLGLGLAGTFVRRRR